MNLKKLNYLQRSFIVRISSLHWKLFVDKEEKNFSLRLPMNCNFHEINKKCESVRRKSFWHLRLGKHEFTRSHFTYSSIICSIVSKLFQLSKRFHLQIKQTFAPTISFTDRQQRLGCCAQCLSYFQSTLGSRFRFNVQFLFCVCFSIRLQPRIRCDVFWSRVVADLVNYSVLKRCLHWKRPRQVLSLSVGNRHMLAWDQNFAGKFNWKWENWRDLQKCFLIAFDVLCNLKFQSEEVFMECKVGHQLLYMWYEALVCWCYVIICAQSSERDYSAWIKPMNGIVTQKKVRRRLLLSCSGNV